MSRQLHIVCVSGTHEKLQMAAMIASVAAASGDEVTVFFSMNSLAYFVKSNTADAPAEGEFGKLMNGKNVPPFKQLFKQAVEFGEAKLLPCAMAVDVLKIGENGLDPEFGPPTGLTSFLNKSEGGQLLTF